VYLRTTSDAHLHQLIVKHLQHAPDTYLHIWEFYQGSEGALLNLLQRMLDAGEIAVDHLKDGLISDDSLITLVGTENRKAVTKRAQPLLHLLSLRIPFA
jgi:hypothetical protein